MLCKNCSRPLESEDKFCPECGTRTEQETVSDEQVSTVTSAEQDTTDATSETTDETVNTAETAEEQQSETVAESICTPEASAPINQDTPAQQETVQPSQTNEAHYTGAQYIPPVTVNGGAQQTAYTQQQTAQPSQSNEAHYTGAQYIPPVTVNDGARQNANPPQQPMYITNPTVPMTFGQWLGTLFLMLIPFANLILLLVWSFSSKTNLNKQNFARAYLVYGVIVYAIVFVLYLAIFAALITLGVTFGEGFFNQFMFA